MSSGGTVPKSTDEFIGISAFFTPESRHTCTVFNRFGVLFIVHPILIVPKIAVDCITGLFNATLHSHINIVSDSSSVIPMLFMSYTCIGSHCFLC